MKKLLIAGLLAIPVVGAAKKRRIIGHLSGKTETEARELILAKATPRVGPEKAEAIAERIIAQMSAHGRLASEPGIN